jgi:hypothetical protein
MALRALVKRIEQAEETLRRAAYENPNGFKPLYRAEKTERLRRMGRLGFEAEVEATAASMDGNTGLNPSHGVTRHGNSNAAEAN